jgi:ATP/maltotriose-dependent transcriptional regulator MalT
MIQECRLRCSPPSRSRRRGVRGSPPRRLLDHLDTTLDVSHRLNVSAPAGFGKTTMLGDWLTRLGQGNRSTRAAWVPSAAPTTT